MSQLGGFTQSNLFSNDQGGDNFYSDFRMRVTYATDMGVLGMPVAGPPGTPIEVIQIHGGMTYKVVEFVAEREIVPPRVPHPGAVDPNNVLKFWRVTPATPVLLPSGLARVWQVSGTYVYLLKVPFGDTPPNLPTGASPADVTGASSNDFPAGNFDSTLSPVV